MLLCRILRSFSTGKSIAFTTFQTGEKFHRSSHQDVLLQEAWELPLDPFCCKEGYNPDQEFKDVYECLEMDQGLPWPGLSTTKPIPTLGSKCLSLLVLWISMVCGSPMLMVVGCSPAARSRGSLSTVVSIWIVW
jgi:hypothetical protein